MDSWSAASFLLGVGVGALSTLAATLWLVLNRFWRHAKFSGVPIPAAAILGMRLRGTPPGLIVDTCVILSKRGGSADWAMIEAAYLATGLQRLTADELASRVERELAKRNA